MENIRIEILQDTPFDKKGTQLKIVDFRCKYGWICTNTTTNEELIKYLQIEWKLASNQIREYQKQIGEWFKVVELENLEPLSFIYEGVYFVKDFDGVYRGYSNPDQYELRETYAARGINNVVVPVKLLTIQEVRKLIETTKYKQNILYCTNSVNKKL